MKSLRKAVRTSYSHKAKGFPNLTAEIISLLELLHSDEWLAVPRSATAQPHGGDYSGVTDWSGFQMDPSAIYKTVKYFANLQDIYILSLQLRFSKVNEIHHPNRFEEAVDGCLFLPANSTPDISRL